MKRYRIFLFDFDTRAHLLDPVEDQWEETVKRHHLESQEQIIQELKSEFGEDNSKQKIVNFRDLSYKPFSILAYHNRFLEQSRRAFVIGSYYPALAGVCALGERILNHLIIKLRDDFKSTPEYKKVHNKDSFENWDLAINTLENWRILLPEVVVKFKELKKFRNNSLHFSPNTAVNDRDEALKTVKLMQEIIEIQFSAFKCQPWVLNVPGEVYIKKEYETNSFIKNIFLPNCLYVGFKHKVESIVPKLIVKDHFFYEDKEISDDEYFTLRKQNSVIK